jgi:hypothetical protein
MIIVGHTELSNTGGEFIAVEDLDELADNAAIALVELQPLIDMAEEKGYLSVDDDGSVRLTQRGWRWYEKYNPPA